MRLSVLDLFNTPTDTLALARIADPLGYHRYWIGEHHNEWQCGNPLLLSALVALHTRRIRVGTGATSLLLRSPYLVAEDALLAREILGERLDLGVAPAIASPVLAKDAITMGRGINRDEYPERVRQLHAYLGGSSTIGPRVRGSGLHTIPMWILGNSHSAAELAAAHGAGFCVSFHHGASVEEARDKIELYRDSFRACGTFEKPLAMIVVSGLSGPASVVEALRAYVPGATSDAPRLVEYAGTYSDVADRIRTLITRTGADEAMILNMVFIQHIDRNGEMLEGLADAWRAT